MSDVPRPARAIEPGEPHASRIALRELYGESVSLRFLREEGLSRALETIDRLRAQWPALPHWTFSVAVLVKYVSMVVPPVVAFVVQRFFKAS
jgi:hypothetical protein